MKQKSAGLAAFLSFLFPGLGHLYLGYRRQAIIFALPALLLAAVIVVQLLRGIDFVLASLITPSGSMTILVLILLAGGWRIIAMIDSLALARRRQEVRRLGTALAALLIAVIVGTHGTAAYVAYTTYDATSKIFASGGADDPDPTPAPADTGGTAGTAGGSGSPSTSGEPSVAPTDDFEASPEATPATAQARINILLTGVDSAETRTTALTDTLLVVSVNPEDNSVVMLSLPRDISNFPLYDGRTFTGKINSFMTWVRMHPKDFKEKPFPALIKEVGYLVGVPIHYYAAVDLAGFRRLIDEVGGVTVDNPRAINDPRYDWLDGTSGFTLPAGKVTLSGRKALAYARSRQGVGDSDFTRAARQQQLLVALRAKLVQPEMITKIPDIIKVAGDTVRTNLPTDRLEEFIALARGIDTHAIDQYVLGPPYSVHPSSDTTNGIYTLKLKMDRMAKLSIKLFGDDSRYSK